MGKTTIISGQFLQASFIRRLLQQEKAFRGSATSFATIGGTNMTSLPSRYASNPNFGALYRNPTSRRYTPKNTQGESITSENDTLFIVDEVMAECVANDVVPRKLLNHWIAGLTAFQNLTASTDHELHSSEMETTANFAKFSRGLDSVLSMMRNNLEFLRTSNKSFKRSSEKADSEKAFVPTNLHLQSVTIESRRRKTSSIVTTKSAQHDVTTVGAFTAQHIFKDEPAGLESLWRRVSSPDANSTLGDSLNEGSVFVRYPTTLETFRKSLAVAAAWSDYSSVESSECQQNIAGKTLLTYLDGLSAVPDGGAQLPEGNLNIDAVKSLLEDRILSSKRETLSPEFKRRISGALRLLLLDSVKSMETTANGSLPDVFLRECIVMSQMISATTSAILTAFHGGSSNAMEAAAACDRGILIYYESLLSCWVDEKVMMEDMIGGLELLRSIDFVLPVDIDHNETVEAPGIDVESISIKYLSSGQIQIQLPGLSVTRSKRPAITTSTTENTEKEKIHFKVFPVFLNIGVNEAASLAVRQGKIGLQMEVNKHYGALLLDYTAKLDRSDEKFTAARADFAACMTSTAPKNIDLLHAAQRLTRLAGGLRVTMCKSAKDRTAMAVTLEQVAALRRACKGLGVAEYDRILTEMRRNGTRRENTVKNIGRPLYAFIREQVEHLPAVYQPPPGTYGKSET